MTDDQAARQRWMGVLARAKASEIEARLASVAPLPPHTRLRGPELGSVMVQGRAGGAGAAFHLGEMTVVRCTVRNSDGYLGHAYAAGQDVRQAELAAALDAALQDPTRRTEIEAAVVTPLARVQAERRAAVAADAAATRVQFFTMANMRS